MPDKALITELKSALAHLDDPPFLETHALSRRLGWMIADAADLSTGQRLRRALLLGIETLDPGSDFPPQAPEARPYQVMRQYYVARRDIEQVALTLAISKRQAYRELRRGTEALVQILFPARPGARPGIDGQMLSAVATRVRREMERVSAVGVERLELTELLQSALRSVSLLAERKRIAIRTDAPEALTASANRVMMRQALVNLLSNVLRTHQQPELLVRLARDEETACLTIAFQPTCETTNAPPSGPHAVARQLFTALGLVYRETDKGDGRRIARVHIPLARKFSVLVVDDNAGVARLLQSYLRREPLTVYGVADPHHALELTQELEPDVIILDVMMPGLDGWEFLERVRRTPAGGEAAIIISSVINDPELASALGADAFLHKPVDRARLIHTLNQVLSPAQRPAAEGQPPLGPA